MSGNVFFLKYSHVKQKIHLSVLRFYAGCNKKWKKCNIRSTQDLQVYAASDEGQCMTLWKSEEWSTPLLPPPWIYHFTVVTTTHSLGTIQIVADLLKGGPPSKITLRLAASQILEVSMSMFKVTFHGCTIRKKGGVFISKSVKGAHLYNRRIPVL